MLQNLVDYKAKSFLSEQNTSTIAYEVKAKPLWNTAVAKSGSFVFCIKKLSISAE